MTPSESFLLLVKWLHAVSAVIWVGGSLFYLLVLRPATHSSNRFNNKLNPAIASEFRAIVNVCIIVLIATGVILAMDRLTEGVVGSPYVITLGVKVVLSIWMFIQVQSQRRSSRALEVLQENDPVPPNLFARTIGALSGYNALVIVVVVVLFLSDLLDTLFEQSLAGVR